MNYDEAVEDANKFSLQTGLVAYVLEFDYGYDWVAGEWIEKNPGRSKEIMFTTSPCELDPDLCISDKDLKKLRNLSKKEKDKLLKKTLDKIWQRFQ